MTSRRCHPISRRPAAAAGLLLAALVFGAALLYDSATGRPAAHAAEVAPARPLPPSWLMWLTALQRVQHQGLDQIVSDRRRWIPAPYRATLARGPYSRREVALTFDDGPHPSYTPQLLALLRRYHAHATFFVVGQQARQYPNLVQQEIADGHSVGNHTYHHVNLIEAAQPERSAEIVACGDVLQSITGKRPHLFRPPGGRYNRQVLTLTHALGYTNVLWTDNSHDYLNPSPIELKDRVFSGVGNGEIILLHDGVKENLTILAALLEYLRATGRQCVTVDEMLKQGRPGATLAARHRPAQPKPGARPTPKAGATVEARRKTGTTL